MLSSPLYPPYHAPFYIPDTRDLTTAFKPAFKTCPSNSIFTSGRQDYRLGRAVKQSPLISRKLEKHIDTNEPFAVYPKMFPSNRKGKVEDFTTMVSNKMTGDGSDGSVYIYDYMEVVNGLEMMDQSSFNGEKMLIIQHGGRRSEDHQQQEKGIDAASRQRLQEMCEAAMKLSKQRRPSKYQVPTFT